MKNKEREGARERERDRQRERERVETQEKRVKKKMMPREKTDRKTNILYQERKKVKGGVTKEEQ